MKDVLIVGIEGKLGSTLKSYLECTGVNIYGTSHKSNPHTTYLNLAHPQTYAPPNHNIDVIYLCAGITNINQCEIDPHLTYHINVGGVIEVAKKFLDKRPLIIFTSTNHVFSGEKPYASTLDIPCPQNQYGLQKYEVERWLLNEYQNAVIVRLTKVIDTNLNLFQNWHDSLLHGMPIEAFTDMTFSPVLLKQVMKILLKLGQIKTPGIYHVSGQEDISYFDFAKILICKMRLSTSLLNPMSASKLQINTTLRPKYTSLDCTETSQITGAKPPTPSEVINYMLLQSWSKISLS